MKLIRNTITIYDNGGKTADRYTIIFEGPDFPKRMDFLYALGSSSNPFHPQGFGQHVEVIKGKHLGKEIEFADLPKDVQRFVARELHPGDWNGRALLKLLE